MPKLIRREVGSMVSLYPSATSALMEYDRVPCDRSSVPQDFLDLANKTRRSIFPWRGQFSPELVELFLTHYALPGQVVLDPFAGSGTTLFEAIRKGLACYGAEINPAAVVMASTAHFARLSALERQRHVERAEAIVSSFLSPYRPRDLFSYQEAPLTSPAGSDGPLESTFPLMLEEARHESYVCNLLANAVIRYFNSEQEGDPGSFARALREQVGIIQRLPHSQEACQLFHADARNLPLPSGSVDIVITSPPYINVFNYHQNNRVAMESIGWNLLRIARSEIGANRKHRQNRFLTVVQYALDMLDVLREFQRLLRSGGRVIIVVGRVSSVRGATFENGRIVAALAVGAAAFAVERRQERKFKNKFGELIYEDILHLRPDPTRLSQEYGFARSVATEVLAAAEVTAKQTVRLEIREAIERADFVKRSPLFELR